MPFTNNTVGFIGAGNMAEALISSMIKSGVCNPERIWASDVNADRGQILKDKYNINFSVDNKILVNEADYLIYAVKPFMMGQVLSEVSPFIKKEQVQVSIAAGISLSFIEGHFPEGVPVVRVMPNTPSLVGAGASAYAVGKAVSPEAENKVKEILDSAGVSVKVQEHLIDSVTGLSGSGPAYVFLIIEALADAGVKAGLPRDTSVLLAAQTLLGSAKMVLETGEHTAKLKDMVTTPAGTTIAALHVLEQGKLRAVLMDAVTASVERARELGSGK